MVFRFSTSKSLIKKTLYSQSLFVSRPRHLFWTMCTSTYSYTPKNIFQNGSFKPITKVVPIASSISIASNNKILFPSKSLKGSFTRFIHMQKTHLSNSTTDNFEQNKPIVSVNKTLDLSFSNAQEAYKSKTNTELLRALLVFNLCSIKFLVDNTQKLLRISRRVLGRRLFEKSMKGSFYGHFVAGEDVVRIKPLVDKNRLFGVKSILDYSVEKDLSTEAAKKVEMDSLTQSSKKSLPDLKGNRFKIHQEFGDRREQVYTARTYFYEDEANCDENMNNFIKGIDAVSDATNATGFAAIKLTALGRPQFLMQLSEMLSRIRSFYDKLIGNENKLTFESFEKYMESISIGKQDREKWYHILDSDQDGQIDFLDWHNLLEVNMSLVKLLKVPDSQTGKMVPLVAEFTEPEEQQMKNMLKRLTYICDYAVQKDVRLMIDAEQTYFQVSINRLCIEMMRKFNKEKAYIFNTYQCYLKDALNTITNDLALSKQENFYFGCKLVRGAYIDQERKRAFTLGYEDPINSSYEDTTAMYEQVLECVLNEINSRRRGLISVMIASHNEETVRHTIEQMEKHNVKAEDKLICFGQLLGMCDQISFPLGQAGYSVYKYVPYGPVEEVLPYLARRAMENKGVLKKVKKEKLLLKSELKRRFINGQVFYKPPRPLSPFLPK